MTDEESRETTARETAASETEVAGTHDDGGREDDHLQDVPAGAGCTEIWEHLSENRENGSGEKGNGTGQTTAKTDEPAGDDPDADEEVDDDR